MARFDSYSAKIRIFRIFQNRVKVVPWQMNKILYINISTLACHCEERRKTRRGNLLCFAFIGDIVTRKTSNCNS